MEANCFVAFSPIPYYLEKSYWLNTPTLYERCKKWENLQSCTSHEECIGENEFCTSNNTC